MRRVATLGQGAHVRCRPRILPGERCLAEPRKDAVLEMQVLLLQIRVQISEPRSQTLIVIRDNDPGPAVAHSDLGGRGPARGVWTGRYGDRCFVVSRVTGMPSWRQRGSTASTAVWNLC